MRSAGNTPSRQRSSGHANMRYRGARRQSARSLSSTCNHSATMMGDVEFAEPATRSAVSRSGVRANSFTNASNLILRPRTRTDRRSGPVTRSSSRASSTQRPESTTRSTTSVRKRPRSMPLSRSPSTTRSKRAKVTQRRRHSSPFSVRPQSIEVSATPIESVNQPSGNITADSISIPHPPLDSSGQYYSGVLSTSNSSSLTYSDVSTHRLCKGGSFSANPDILQLNASSVAWPVCMPPAVRSEAENKSSSVLYLEDDSQDSDENCMHQIPTEPKHSHVSDFCVHLGADRSPANESGSIPNEENRSLSYSYQEDSIS